MSHIGIAHLTSHFGFKHLRRPFRHPFASLICVTHLRHPFTSYRHIRREFDTLALKLFFPSSEMKKTKRGFSWINLFPFSPTKESSFVPIGPEKRPILLRTASASDRFCVGSKINSEWQMASGSRSRWKFFILLFSQPQKWKSEFRSNPLLTQWEVVISTTSSAKGVLMGAKI